MDRAARPFKREPGRQFDTKLFIVACDDTYAPKQYFQFFQIQRVHVHVEPAVDGKCSANAVLDRLLGIECEEGDERWLLLDVDHYAAGTHLQSFIAALQRARQNGIRIALSKPCFELWLLLHQEDCSSGGTRTAAEVQDRLDSLLGKYDKSRLKPEHYQNRVADAFLRARSLDAETAGGEIPSTDTTRVYLLWQSIAASLRPWQVPPELLSLLPESDNH